MVELLLLAAALSADNFAVSIGYGSSNTRISPGMTALLNLFCSAVFLARLSLCEKLSWRTRCSARYKRYVFVCLLYCTAVILRAFFIKEQ